MAAAATTDPMFSTTHAALVSAFSAGLRSYCVSPKFSPGRSTKQGAHFDEAMAQAQFTLRTVQRSLTVVERAFLAANYLHVSDPWSRRQKLQYCRYCARYLILHDTETGRRPPEFVSDVLVVAQWATPLQPAHRLTRWAVDLGVAYSTVKRWADHIRKASRHRFDMAFRAADLALFTAGVVRWQEQDQA